MISNFTELYYRGPLNSCNYSCGYCPFSKKKADTSVLEADRRQLIRFVDRVERSPHVERVFLLPYGEAMVHRHYWDALARLSRIPHIRGVAVQTNNSFYAGDFLQAFREFGGIVSRLTLWCSFHPGQTSAEEFAAGCRTLDAAGVTLTAGAVADYSRRADFLRLRAALPDHIYMWLNAMDGMKRAYSQKELDFFAWLDPFFPLECQKPAADYSRCTAGKTSALVLGNGTLLPCNRAGRPMGNLYSGSIRPGSCSSGTCDCFLSRSRRDDLPLLRRFSPSPMFRVPAPTAKPLYFFDIDGTLTGPDGRIPEALTKALTRLSRQGMLLFATALPAEIAEKRCRPVRHLFSGGVLLSGAHILLPGAGLCQRFPLPPDALAEAGISAAHSLAGRHNDLRIILPASRRPAVLPDDLRAEEQNGRIIITAGLAGKLQGIRFVRRCLLASNNQIHLFDNNPAILSFCPEFHCHYVQGPEQLVRLSTGL